MLLLAYTGFIRLVTDEKYYTLSLVFGHTFEMFSSTIPLLMLQCYNNKFLAKFDGLDFLSVFLSVLNFADLVMEISLIQLISQGDNYYLLNRSHIGYKIAR